MRSRQEIIDEYCEQNKTLGFYDRYTIKFDGEYSKNKAVIHSLDNTYAKMLADLGKHGDVAQEKRIIKMYLKNE